MKVIVVKDKEKEGDEDMDTSGMAFQNMTGTKVNHQNNILYMFSSKSLMD